MQNEEEKFSFYGAPRLLSGKCTASEQNQHLEQSKLPLSSQHQIVHTSVSTSDKANDESCGTNIIKWGKTWADSDYLFKKALREMGETWWASIISEQYPYINKEKQALPTVDSVKDPIQTVSRPFPEQQRLTYWDWLMLKYPNNQPKKPTTFPVKRENLRINKNNQRSPAINATQGSIMIRRTAEPSPRTQQWWSMIFGRPPNNEQTNAALPAVDNNASDMRSISEVHTTEVNLNSNGIVPVLPETVPDCKEVAPDSKKVMPDS